MTVTDRGSVRRGYVTEKESKLAVPLRKVGAVPVLGTYIIPASRFAVVQRERLRQGGPRHPVDRVRPVHRAAVPRQPLPKRTGGRTRAEWVELVDLAAAVAVVEQSNALRLHHQ